MEETMKESRLKDVTRFEVIDHRTCKRCDGRGFEQHENSKPIECEKCQGGGFQGRAFVAYDVKVSESLQDDNRTLKIFVNDAEYNLKYCSKCNQMTNHLSDKCQKHKEVQ